MDEELKQYLQQIKREIIEEIDARYGEKTSELRSIAQEISRRLDRLDILDERMSFYQSALAMLQVQQQGSGAIPDRKRSVQGGYGALEPRSAWRRERPYLR